MKQKKVGTYYSGNNQVDLSLREGVGGEFYRTPEKGKLPRIKIGVEYDHWVEVLNVLMHEIFEYNLDLLKLRFQATDAIIRNHEDYIFMFTHAEYSDICMKCSEFISECYKDLKKEWKAFR